MTAFVDSNVLIRHLTGDPPDMARRATALIREADEMLLADLILAEIIYVLESFYEVARHEVARLARAVLAFPSIRTIDPAVLLRAIEVYETAHLDFAEAYLVASAETAGVVDIASFDRSSDRLPSVNRIEP